MTQFPETDYTLFFPLQDAMERFVQTRPRNLTAQRILSSNGAIKLISDELAQLGFRRVLDKIHPGNSALVFEGNNHQMLRIVARDVGEVNRPVDWSVLQPLHTIECGIHNKQFRIELLPKVHTLAEIVQGAKAGDTELLKYNITEADVPLIIDQLRAYHRHQRSQLFYDDDPENICIIRDEYGNNVPLVIDPDAFDTKRDTVLLQWTFEQPVSPLPEQPMPNYDFEAAQLFHLKRLGLERGKANHVISRTDLDRFYDERGDTVKNPEQRVWTRMAESDGLPLKQIGSIITVAANKFLKDPDTDPSHKKSAPNNGFCHEIELARKKAFVPEAEKH